MEKKKNSWKVPVIILLIILAIVGIVAAVVMYLIQKSNIEIAMSDVYQVASTIIPYVIGMVVVLILIGIVCIAAKKAGKATKFLIHAQAIIAAVLAVAITINAVCFGPVYSLLGNVLADSIELSSATAEQGKQVMDDISDEGIVLLKNEDATLPLKADTKKLNIFGWSSTNPNYGGWGSGSASSDFAISLLDGIRNAGYEVNEDLVSFYTEYQAERPEASLASQDWTIVEPTIADYDNAGIFDNAKAFSDTAIVVLARNGGENADLPTSITDENTLDTGTYGKKHVYTTNEDDINPDKNYLSLSNREEAMIDRVATEFENVIVVVNSNNTMELGWVNDYASIKSVLWMAGAGERGFGALGRILDGEVNPSGKLPDTYVYDNMSAPYANNAGDFRYDNMTDVVNTEGQQVWLDELYASFVNYVEGIYVGYRYYETADAEGSIDYEKTVLYPFGYGMSYTSFDKKISNIQDDGKTITLDVTVTNTGDVAGKEVAEIYYTPPYYNGGIEKSAVNLIEFAKTKMLEPGESQTLTISFYYEDMASYDDKTNKSYVLEHGDYEISLRQDAHTVVDSVNVSVDKDIIYNDENDGKRSSDDTTAVNEFDFAEGDITYLSRTDHFANYEEATAAPASFSLSEEAISNFLCTATYNVEEHQDENAVMPTTGTDNGLTIRDLAYAEYDDERWEQLLDQLSVEDLVNLVSFGGYSNMAISSIGLKATSESEGVSGISSIYSNKGGSALPVSTMTAATWNKELAKKRGELLGVTAQELHITGVYCPSMNTHRTAFDGRNFEYYSEDGILAGNMAANEILGASEYGLLTYIKHFALNDQESNRNNIICTWSNEQAIREIYLKPFEMAVKEGGAKACMSSFNYIGNRFAGACNELLNVVLRDEWGFQGVVVTDWFADYGYMVSDDIIRNGGDKMLTVGGTAGVPVDQTSATAISAMRTGAHNLLYALANSNAMDESNYVTPTWEKIFHGVDIVLVALVLLAEVFVIRAFLKKKKEQETVKVEKISEE